MSFDSVKREVAYRLVKACTATGVASLLPDGAVQKGYKALAEQGRSDDIIALHKRTGVMPLFSDEDVQKGYKTLAKHGRADDIAKLHEITGVPLSPEIAQLAHNESRNKKNKK